MARNLFSYGPQHDYFDHGSCIGWTREGSDDQSGSGCAVIMSNGDEGFKRMHMGEKFAGKKFTDMLGKYPGEVTVEEDGCGEFHVSARSVSVWVVSS